MRDHDQIGLEVPDDLQESRVGDPAPRSRGTKQRPVSRDVAVAEEMHEMAVAGEAVGELALDDVETLAEISFAGVADDEDAHFVMPWRWCGAVTVLAISGLLGNRPAQRTIAPQSPSDGLGSRSQPSGGTTVTMKA